MVALGTAGLILGSLLGLRFRVLVLVPVEMLALLIAVVGMAVGHVGLSTALTGFLVFSLFVQVSYAAALVVPAMMRRTTSSKALQA